MPGCNVTRREMLRWMAVAGAGPSLPFLPVRARAGDVVATGLELVTLTEDRAVFTWFTGIAGSDDGLGRTEPTPADAVVAIGDRPDRLDREVGSGRTDTPYHLVEVDGLEPGRTYFFTARSNGVVATPTPFALVEGDAVSTDPGRPSGVAGVHRFTTPQPPPGRFLFSLVLCNDLHIGETVAGLVGSLPGVKGISQVPGAPPYPTAMTASMVADVDRLGAACLLAAGDVTAEAEPGEVAEARSLLGRLGDQGSDWFAVRGNHDRAHDGEAWASCSVGRWQGHDCFVDEFARGGAPTWTSHELGGLRILGLDTYDKPGDGGDAGELGAEQLDWFRTSLSEDRERPTLVFGHHPLVVEASAFPVSAGSALDVAQATTLRDLYAATPGVFLHHAGHTHRNRRAELGGPNPVVHQEVAAVKEYPGGFTLVRVHEGGYALNFHKLRSDDARAWSERSRMQIGGAWPQFSLGARVSDRNVVVERDLSGLTPPVPVTTTAPVGTPTTSPADAPRESDGPESDGPESDSADGWALVAGSVAVAAAATAGIVVARARRSDEGAEPPA